MVMDPDLATIVAAREQVLERLRKTLIKQLRLERAPDELDPDMPLFGSGLGLDSLDAVEIAVSLEIEFGVHIAEGGASPVHLRTLNTLATLILDGGAVRAR